MFSFLRQKPKTEETLLVCLVTSYAVTAAVVKRFKKPGTVEKPVILFSCESVVPMRHERNSEVLEAFVAESAMKVVNECRSHTPVYDRLVCTIGEPWVTSVARTSHLERREPFALTRKLVDDMVLRETKLFEQEMVRDYAGKEEMLLLEISDPLVDGNGYRIADCVDQLVETVDVTTIFSMGSASMLDKMLGVFVDVFHRTDVTFKSFDLAKQYLLKSYSKGSIFELGGITTQVSVIENAAPSSFAAIPLGLHDFELMLDDSVSVPRRHVPRVLALSGDENILESERTIYDRRIASAYEGLGAEFPAHIGDLRKRVQHFEEPVIIIGHPAWLQVLQRRLEEDIGSPVIVPHPDLLKHQVVLARQAEVVTNPLLLSVLHASHD